MYEMCTFHSYMDTWIHIQMYPVKGTKKNIKHFNFTC